MSIPDPALPPRVPFGRTGQTVYPLSLGCAPLGNMGDTFGYAVADEDAYATINAVLDGPFPFIDTAAWYGDGVSEERVGHVLRERGGLPANAILQTKAGREPETDDFSGDMIRRRFERSLDLLGVSRVEYVYLHDAEHTTFAAATAPDGPIAVLQSLKEQGVIGYLGVAAGPIPVELKYLDLGIFDQVITHNRYTLLNRSAAPLLDYAAERNIAVLNAAPYGSGMLAKGPDAYPRYAYQTASPEMIDRVRQYAAVADRYGVPLPAVALQFSTRDPRIANTIIGMSKPERVAQTLSYYQHPIPDDLWAEIAPIAFEADDPEANRYASRLES